MEHVYRIDTEKLKKAREEAGLSLAGLAVETDMDAYHLALVEQQPTYPRLPHYGVSRALWVCRPTP